jgi:type I restriction enzyme S subunit
MRRLFLKAHLNSVFSNKGEGWVEKKLEDVSKEFGRGKSKHRPRNDPKLFGGPHPFIQTGEVRNSNHIISSFAETYSEFGLAQSKLWPKGTLCITIAANIAETGILGFDACFPDSVIGIVADERCTSGKFLEYMMQSFRNQLKAKGKGSAQDNINMGTFEDLLFPFPDLSVQEILVQQFDFVREESDRLTSLYTQKLSALEELKKSLLHQAFTGKL